MTLSQSLSSLNVVDLFAGCGGLSLGFQLAGFTISAAYDSWEPAISCYKDNFESHDIFNVDLSDVEGAAKNIMGFSPKIIIGGPPCQDFSQAGKRIENNRAALTKCFAEIIAEVKPQYFVMENVARAQKSSVYQQAKKILKKANYGITEIILDASLYEVPQRRKRLFVIGGTSFDDGELTDTLESREHLIPLTVRKAYPELAFDHYYRHPRSYSRRAIFSVDEPAPTIRGVNRPKPKNYTPHKNDTSNSPSIRALSPRERAMIQTFPEDFKFLNGNKADVEQMIGNAVPVNLAKNVAESLAQHILHTSSENEIPFRKWLMQEKGLNPESAKDKISHIRRANRCTSLPRIDDLDGIYTDTLRTSEGFCSASKSSQNQMIKAIELLIAYSQTY